MMMALLSMSVLSCIAADAIRGFSLLSQNLFEARLRQKERAVPQDVPGVVTAYFVVLAALCCWVGVALQKLQRWAWFVSYGVAVLSFVLDIGLFVHMLRHLPIALLVLGVLRFGLLAWMVGYLTRTSIRAAFGLARVAAARV